jgi:energy-coupling factor transport system permease protein
MGQYVPADSLLHRLDPRAKLFLLLAIMVALFSADDLASLSLWAIAFFGALKISGLSAGVVLRSCRPVFFLAFFSFAFNFVALWKIFVSPVSGAFFLSFLPPFLSALHAGAAAASRLLLLFLFAALLPMTTAPLALTDGVESLLSPFKRLGFPAHEFAMMMGVALRFIPLLAEETDRIVKAQLSRGARLDQGGAARRVIAFSPVIIPLFVMVFQRADELALAMEARGYRGGEGRTRWRPLVWKKCDTGATIFVMALIAAFTFLRVFFWGGGR